MTVPAISPGLGDAGQTNAKISTTEVNIRARPPRWHGKQALGNFCHLFWSRDYIGRHFGCVHARGDGVYADWDIFESYLSREQFGEMGRGCFRAIICKLFLKVNTGPTSVTRR